MPPPTSTDDQQGTVIDGTAHSAEWREKQRAAEQPQVPGSHEASPAPPAPDFDSAAAKDFVSSLMIPADKLLVEARQEPAAPKPPDAYITTLLDGARERQATQELEVQPGVSSAQSDELDRWFEEQATSAPNMPAAQKLPTGSASLDIETAAADVKRARHMPALGLRRSRARENDEQRRDEQRRGRTGPRRLPSGVRVTRMRVVVVTMLAVCSIVAIAIAAGGSPVHRPPISSARASTSTTLLGALDTFISKAGRLAGLESSGVRARLHRHPAHRTPRAPRRRPSAHPAGSTSVAPSRSYTPRLTSQTDNSPAAAAAAAASTTSGGASSPPASTGSSGASSPAPSGSSQTRTGPSGPISLIGAGTTPSG